MNDIITFGRELSLQQKEYDYDVEIFRNGRFFNSFISQVRVGDCFSICDKPQWFKCTTPIKKSIYQNKISFVLGTVEVLQAKPIINMNTIEGEVLKITYDKEIDHDT
jgi:hypothetical protein